MCSEVFAMRETLKRLMDRLTDDELRAVYSLLYNLLEKYPDI